MTSSAAHPGVDPAPAASAGHRRGALARRLITIPRHLLLFAAFTVALPPLALIASLLDAVRWARGRTPATALRLLAFLGCYLAAEVAGLAVLAALWLGAGVGAAPRRRRLLDGTYAVQRVWAGFLFASVRRIFRLRFEVEGDACAAPGPILVFIRHTSIADTLLPTTLITARHGVRLRFILKRELLQDPCLDVAGHRIPNHFVARGARDDAELEAIRALTRDLGPRDGVLIYPEGTRFTEQKHRLALEKLTAGDPGALATAERYRHVLPPRLGGPLALLDGHTPADVVFFAHCGLDGFAEIRDIWRGTLVGRTVRARLWRVPRAEIPADPDARIAWLRDQWAELDAWVGRTAGG